jgi:signal transduction histidine kinase
MVTGVLQYILYSSRWLSLAMLATLHLALLAGMHTPLAKSLLLVHLGLFLLWQPLWRGESKLSRGRAVFILGSSAVALLWLSWWVLAFWVSGLFALVGGRVLVFQSLWRRLHYQLVMVYLLAVLLFWITPHLFSLQYANEAGRSLMELALPLLLGCMVLVPNEQEYVAKTQAVDFVYSILLFMLLILLVLGSLVFMSQAGVEYFEALLRTLFLMALLLFLLGWLWNPRMGFSGLQPIFSRYFLNIGTPFEEWLERLAATAQQERASTDFLAHAMSTLAELPWLSGLSWECEEGHGNLGLSSPHRIEVSEHDLHLTLFSKRAISPSVLLHIHLLVRLLGHFYQAKRHEQSLREMARLHAVYETGARLTHDLKNMVQSLLALATIAEHQPDKAQPLLQSQLPILAHRMEATLAKLKSPQPEAESSALPLAQWWETLKQRHQHRSIHWLVEGKMGNQAIPATLFDSVADNLIDNACHKLLREPGIRISVTLQVQPFSLQVCDGGSAILDEVASKMLHTVLSSEDGLGVGLFQAARWAEQSGYHLALRDNVAGRVCFELKPAAH